MGREMATRVGTVLPFGSYFKNDFGRKDCIDLDRLNFGDEITDRKSC